MGVHYIPDGYGSCTAEGGMFVRLGGAVTDTDLRVMLSPTFPVWPETNGTGPGGRVMMRSYAKWSGWVGESKPGAKVLVSGQVQARSDLLGGTILPADWPLFGSERGSPSGVAGESDLEGQSSHVALKIAVRRAKQPGWVLIDADSHVVMDAGELEIHVLGPDTWVAFPATIDAGEQLAFTFATVRVFACPLTCCWPPSGRLTFFGLMDPGGEPEERQWVRPRRGTALRLTNAPPAGLTVRSLYTSDTILSANMGEQTVNGGFVNTVLDPWGATALFEILNVTGPQLVEGTWEIS